MGNAREEQGAALPNERSVWKAHSGGAGLPTVALSFVAFAGQGVVLFAHATGRIGDGGACALAALLAYVAFTPMHEASHGNVGGARRWLGTLVGWLGGLQLAAPYPAFRLLHLRHHSHTNDDARDPDMWVSTSVSSVMGSFLELIARCATLMPHYYYRFLFGDVATGKQAKSKSGRSARWQTVAGIGMLAALGLGASLAGWGGTILWAWLLPAWIATAALGFLFDWLPHQPHAIQGRYLDTRAIDFPLGIPMLGQHLHLVHHLYPRVPFYAYRKVFDQLRPVLEAKGAAISGGSTRAATVAPTTPATDMTS